MMSRSKSIEGTRAKVSKKFVKKMQNGNINGAIKLLSNNMENGVLHVNDETVNMLYQKHPDASKASSNVLSISQQKSTGSISMQMPQNRHSSELKVGQAPQEWIVKDGDEYNNWTIWPTFNHYII